MDDSASSRISPQTIFYGQPSSSWSKSAMGADLGLPSRACSQVLSISVSPRLPWLQYWALPWRWVRASPLRLTRCSWNSPSSLTVLCHLKANSFQIADFSARSLFLVLRDTSPYFKSQNLPFPHSRSAPPCRPAILVWWQLDLFSIPQLSSRRWLLITAYRTVIRDLWQQAFTDWQALT